MKRSTERILTTHAGSLPQPDDLKEMVVAKNNGRPYDQEALARRVRSAVAEAVRKQLECGLDRKSTRLNSSHIQKSRMPSSA